MSAARRDLDAELDALRGRQDNYRRAVTAFTVAMAVVVVFAMGTAAAEVQRFAVDAGFGKKPAWLLDPIVGLALLVLLAGSALLADAGQKAPLWGRLGEYFAGASTLAMNCWPSVHDRAWDGVLLHAVMPTLLVVFAAAAPEYRRRIAAASSALREEEEALLKVAATADQERLDARRLRAEEAAAAERTRRRVLADEQRQQEQARAAREEEASNLRLAEAERFAELDRRRRADELAVEQEREEAAARRERERLAAATAAEERRLLAAAALEDAKRRQAPPPPPPPRRRTAPEQAPPTGAGTVADRILAHLLKGAATKAQLAAATSAAEETVKTQLTALRKDGRIEPDPDVTYGWRLTPQHLAVAR